VKDKLQRLVRQAVCLVLGHRPAFNAQAYEQVTVHGLNGKQRNEIRLVEREWCGRCRKLLSVDLPNKGIEWVDEQRPGWYKVLCTFDEMIEPIEKHNELS